MGGLRNLRQIFFAAPFLIGTWFGIGQPDDKGNMWIARMGADGSFHAQFRSCFKGKGLEQFAPGHWQLNGDTETINLTGVDGRPFSREDIYKVLSHDAQKQVYRYLLTGFVYTSHRVADDFQMPSCETIS